jgi:hypothetical protein
LVKHLPLVYFGHSGIFDHDLVVFLQSIKVARLYLCPQTRRIRWKLESLVCELVGLFSAFTHTPLCCINFWSHVEL